MLGFAALFLLSHGVFPSRLCLKAVGLLQLLDKIHVFGLCLFRSDLLVDDLLPSIVLVLALEHHRDVSQQAEYPGP